MSLVCPPHINLQTPVFPFYTKIVLFLLLMPRKEMGYNETEYYYTMKVLLPQFASVPNDWVINCIHNTSQRDE